MARLNIEDEFFNTITPVGNKIGLFNAIGAAIYFFKLAQEKYKRGEFITEEEFKFYGLPDELFPFIAERTSGGIQAVNADKFFGWLRSRVESGRKGGQSNNPKKQANLKQFKNTEAKPKQNDILPKQTGVFTEASPSPSPSASSKEDAVEQHQIQFVYDLSKEVFKGDSPGEGFIPPKVERHLNKVLVHFKTPENYKQWLEDLINTNPLANYQKNKNFRRYVTNAILNEIGEHHPVRWNK